MVCKSRGQMQNLKLNSFVVSCVFLLCLLVFFLKVICKLIFYIRVRVILVVLSHSNPRSSWDGLLAFINVLKIGALILSHWHGLYIPYGPVHHLPQKDSRSKRSSREKLHTDNTNVKPLFMTWILLFLLAGSGKDINRCWIKTSSLGPYFIHWESLQLFLLHIVIITPVGRAELI